MPDNRDPSTRTDTTPLRVEGVVKRFGDVTAVAGISFSIQPGACFGLLGPNGAGKSTLIRSIVGRVRLDAGSVSIFGHPVGSTAARADLGWVPQELAVYPLLTCRENLEAFGHYEGLRGKLLGEAIGWCLDWAALADRASSPVKTLSGGMKRRLNMAAGLIHRPRLVLLDEPTVGVDPQSRNRIFEMVEALRSQGTTIIYTTHYMEEAERLCDWIAIIDHGKIIAEGTKEAARIADVRHAQLGDHALWRDAHRSGRMGGRAWSGLGTGWSGALRGRKARRGGDAAGRREPRRSRSAGCDAAAAESRVGVPATDREGAARMIGAILQTSFRSLRRDRGAFVMSFILPIGFFTIFGFVFGSMRSSSTPRVSVIVVDEDHSDASRSLVQGLEREPSLNAYTRPRATKENPSPRRLHSHDGGGCGSQRRRSRRADYSSGIRRKSHFLWARRADRRSLKFCTTAPIP